MNEYLAVCMFIQCMGLSPVVPLYYVNQVYIPSYQEQKWNYQQQEMLQMQLSRRLLQLQLEDDRQWNSDIFEQ